MELFHYHHWTNQVEETEKFYVENGFEVSGRFAKVKDGMKTYHPPLQWDDFRKENPVFRIIEVRKGKVNVTFGAAKRIMFDHIGFLVSKEEHDELCNLARQFGWNVNEGDRRTFIGTPSRLRLELQQREDVVEGGSDFISSIEIVVKEPSHVQDFTRFLGNKLENIKLTVGEQLALKKVLICGSSIGSAKSPNEVCIEFVGP
ncbi:hypothetical protein [Ornithinibacillus halotolerans]|uniref:Uncharacterized protein n=1 Tax=Ornithinibacillus halotolerans TaxID=1274357 RepID=A0A916W634_9BACI|nr:hypothetical protein [Ornithinibacillus halotolerans]GGA70006.1 hypothetical protein GCM10008025_12450 [Ornithinibacillus halotolerans]